MIFPISSYVITIYKCYLKQKLSSGPVHCSVCHVISFAIVKLSWFVVYSITFHQLNCECNVERVAIRRSLLYVATQDALFKCFCHKVICQWISSVRCASVATSATRVVVGSIPVRSINPKYTHVTLVCPAPLSKTAPHPPWRDESMAWRHHVLSGRMAEVAMPRNNFRASVKNGHWCPFVADVTTL